MMHVSLQGWQWASLLWVKCNPPLLGKFKKDWCTARIMKKTKREKINLDITKPLVAWTTITAEMGKETVNIDPQVKQAPAQLALPAVERRDNALRTPAKVMKLVMGPIGGRMKQDDATKQKDDSHRTLDPTQILKGKDNADNSLVDTPENTASGVMHKTRASAGPRY